MHQVILMRIAGITLASFLLMSLFTMTMVEAKPQKLAIKKDIKDLKVPLDSKSVKITKIYKSRTLHVGHIVEIQVCAGMEKLYSPDLELYSDRDSIQVTMWGLIIPKTCKTGEFFIAANDPDSISARFSNQNYREPTK